MKGLDKMSQKAIPQYHLSYTEEENRSMHEYLFSVSKSELVTALLELAEYYSDNEENKVKQALDDFAQEIKLRYEMKQRYDKLRKCKEKWEQYLNNLQKYQEAKPIRLKYQQYKERAGSVVKGTSLFESFLGTEYIIKRGLYDREFIRRAILSEDKKSGISCPSEPEKFYTTLAEVPIEELSKETALEKLGKESLRSLITILLRHADDPDKDRKSVPVITFMTRAFSYENHKKEKEFFSSKLMTYDELKNECLNYLKDMEACKEELKRL